MGGLGGRNRGVDSVAATTSGLSGSMSYWKAAVSKAICQVQCD